MTNSLIDTNVYVSRWPARRIEYDDTRSLARMLRDRGVIEAWAGSFDALLHKDIAAVNERLAETCREAGSGVLLPFGSVNPTLPNWEDDVRRCAEVHGMRGIRLHPNYHGYAIADDAFQRLMTVAVEYRLIVQIAVMMEDERMMHPLLRVPPVDLAPLPDALQAVPSARVVLLNALGTVPASLVPRLAVAGEVYFDIAAVEGIGGLGKYAGQLSGDRILFGSYSPMFYFESAALKLEESVLTYEQLHAIRFQNARSLLAASQ